MCNQADSNLSYGGFRQMQGEKTFSCFQIHLGHLHEVEFPLFMKFLAFICHSHKQYSALRYDLQAFYLMLTRKKSEKHAKLSQHSVSLPPQALFEQ